MQNTDSKIAAQLVTNHLLTGRMIPAGQANSSGQPNLQGQTTQPYTQAQPNNQQPNGQFNSQGQPYVQEQFNTNTQPGQLNSQGQPYVQEQFNTNTQPGEPNQQDLIIANGRPGYSNLQGQPLMQGTQQGEPIEAAPGDLNADFTDVYRTGNFGKHFGKVNVARGKRWVLVNGGLALLMTAFTLAATIMMRDYKSGAIRSVLLAFSWMATVSDWFTVASAAFFIWRLSNLRHPLVTLMTMRFSAAFNFVFNMFFFLVGFLSILLDQKDFTGLTKGEVGFLKATFVIITLLMLIKEVTCWAFLFMYWGCPACCQCFAPYCIFEEGREVAPGVANSAGALNIILVGQAAGAMAQEMNRA